MDRPHCARVHDEAAEGEKGFHGYFSLKLSSWHGMRPGGARAQLLARAKGMRVPSLQDVEVLQWVASSGAAVRLVKLGVLASDR
eukprot:4100067-Pleurochrysis_carterae.AAC.1